MALSLSGVTYLRNDDYGGLPKAAPDKLYLVRNQMAKKHGTYLGAHTIIGPQNVGWWGTSDSECDNDEKNLPKIRPNADFVDDRILPEVSARNSNMRALRMTQICQKMNITIREIRDKNNVIVVK